MNETTNNGGRVYMDAEGMMRCSCGAALPATESGASPEVCPVCGAELDYFDVLDEVVERRRVAYREGRLCIPWQS